MIKVNYDSKLKVFEMTGHANAGEAGTDVVCAAASSIAITSFNGIAKFLNETEYDAIEKEGYLKVTFKETNDTVELLLENLLELLQELQMQFPKNIKIIK
jgi:uncharacterized protein YsxB (DUF464 family)